MCALQCKRKFLPFLGLTQREPRITRITQMLEKMPNVECRTLKVFASRCQRNEEDPRLRSLIRVYSCSFVVNGFTAGNEEITAPKAKGVRRGEAARCCDCGAHRSASLRGKPADS